MANQFKKFVKPGPEGRVTLSIPREAFPEDVQKALPAGNTKVAGLEGYDPKETDQGGPAATSLPVRANRVLPKKIDVAVNGKRYVKPEEDTGRVLGDTRDTVASPKDIEKLRKEHAADLKMQTVPGVEPTSQPWTPEEDANPESTTTLELDEEASKKFGITKTKLKPKYGKEQTQAESGAETAAMIDRHIKVYGKGPESKPLIEADQQEVKPGLEELRRERKLKKKRGIKNSGMFDKAGNPIEPTNPGNQGGTVTSAPRVNDEEGLLAESRPADVYQKPKVQSTGTAIPIHNIFPRRDFVPGRTRAETTRQLQAEQDRIRNKRGGRTSTRELDLNRESSVKSGARTGEQEIIAQSKLNERFDSEELRPMHSDEVIAKAKELAGRSKAAGGYGLSPQVVNDPSFEHSNRDIVRKAYVMHHAGIQQDNAGGDIEHLEKYTGRGTTAHERVDVAYKAFQNKERFEKSRNSGTGYTYSTEQGNLDPAKHYFRARSGEAIPMSNTAHPEHPGFNLEGSAVGFMGFTNHPAVGGRPLVKGKMVTGGGDLIHQGWHPYKDEENRTVFEHHDIPQTAVHHADIIKDAIVNKRTINEAVGRLRRGSDAGFDINGLQVLQAKPAPIAGSNPTAPLEGPLLPGKTRERAAADTQSHAYHESKGINSPVCAECVKTASKASRKSAAKKSGNIATELAAASESLASKKEDAQPSKEDAQPSKPSKNEIIAGSDSEGKFIDVSDSTGATAARKNFGNSGWSGKPAVTEDIDAAKAAGHISKSEALELKVSSKSLPDNKSKFKD